MSEHNHVRTSTTWSKGGFMYFFTFGSAIGCMIGSEILSFWVWWWFVPAIISTFVFGFLVGEDFASD